MLAERSDLGARPLRRRAPALDVRAGALGALRALGDRAPTIALGLAASIPVIGSTVKAVRAGWEPAGDDGIIATRGWDVLTSHTPLVGQFSEAGFAIHSQSLHSPGPMLYWLLALPARFGSVTSLPVTMGALNTLAIVGCVVLARRRGGLPLMFAAAGAIALMCQSLSGEAMHDIWNPAAALFPFLLLMFLCWSLACGDRRLLPLIALVASFIVQTHLAYAAPTAVLLAVGAGGLLIRSLRRRRARPAEAVKPVERGEDARAPARAAALARLRRRLAVRKSGASVARPSGPRVWPWALAALAVAAACWTAPAIDQIEHTPGNMTLIVRTVKHRGTPLGASVGWRAVVRSVGMRPWWLYVPASPWERKYDVRRPASTLARDTTIALLACLLLLLPIASLARRWDLLAAAAIGLGLSAAIGLEAASNPSDRLLSGTLAYTMWWGSELGLWVWLTLAWAVWLGLGAFLRRFAHGSIRRLRARTSVASRRVAVALASLAGLGGVAAIGLAVAADARPDTHGYEYASIRRMASAIERAIPPGQTIAFHLGPLDGGTQPMEPALRFLLVRHGDRPLADGSLPRLGDYYVQDDRPVRWILLLTDAHRAQRGMRLVSRVRFDGPRGAEQLSAWVRRA